MSVHICGDLHGHYDMHKLTTKSWPEQKELNKDDFLIILGDAGIVWSTDPEDKTEKNLREWLNDKPFTTLFIDGNHENFERLNQYPEIEFYGGKAHQISHSIFHLMRGEVFTFAGKTVFTMGGGFSIDKESRRNRISWWQEELPAFEELKNGMFTLAKQDMKVDYVLSHTCSHSTFKLLELQVNGWNASLKKDPEENSLRDFLEWIEEKVKYTHWYLGHFHVDLEVDKKHSVLYNGKPLRII